MSGHVGLMSIPSHCEAMMNRGVKILHETRICMWNVRNISRQGQELMVGGYPQISDAGI